MSFSDTHMCVSALFIKTRDVLDTVSWLRCPSNELFPNIYENAFSGTVNGAIGEEKIEGAEGPLEEGETRVEEEEEWEEAPLGPGGLDPNEVRGW